MPTLCNSNHISTGKGIRALPRKYELTFQRGIDGWLGRRFLDPLAGTTLWRVALQAFKKLEQIFPRSARDFLNKMATSIHQTAIGTSDYTQLSDWIDCLLFAIDNRRVMTIEYHSLKSEAPRPIVINPLGLIYHEGVIYLVAIAKEHNEIRHYKIDRLSGVDPSDEQLVDQPGRTLVRRIDSQTAATRSLQKRRPAEGPIQSFVDQYNENLKGFQWSKTAQQILAKVDRARRSLQSLDTPPSV